jgi:tricorn protease
VAFVQAELVSELNVGHAYINSPGDVEDTPRVGVGLLGADFGPPTPSGDAAAAFPIQRIITGAAWDTDARGPLSQPGIDVKAGEFLLAVNGQRLTGPAARNVYAAFIGTAGKATTITVGPNPAIDDKARDIVVKPVGSEASLRFRAWIERNRAYVQEKSAGRTGYIYVPNTGVDGQDELFRQFFAQRHMDSLIIDERWNGGGQIPTRFIELLARNPVNFWAKRHGNDWPWPPDGHFGPKVMLANGLAGSGGDMFPWLFKHNKIGKVIGTRTWGGLVGISGNPGLIDGGSISVPTFGFYELDGTWGVEGHGVDPDLEIIDDPAKMQNYHNPEPISTLSDPQLDAAIDHLIAELQTKSFQRPTRPKSPDRKGMGLDPKDK